MKQELSKVQDVMFNIKSVLESRYNINGNKLDQHWTEHYIVTKLREVVSENIKDTDIRKCAECNEKEVCTLKQSKHLKLIMYVNMLYLHMLVPSLMEYDLMLNPYAFLQTYYGDYGGELDMKNKIILLLSSEIMNDARDSKKCISMN